QLAQRLGAEAVLRGAHRVRSALRLQVLDLGGVPRQPVLQALPHQQLRRAEQGHARDQQQSAVEDGEPDPDRGAAHGTRYPTPGTVSTTGGSPSLRRSLITVTRTMFVKGSTFSSQARSRRSSAETTAPQARSSSARTANSLFARGTGRP